MASMFGARMRVGPKTMARFSAFIRLNFSFSATLQVEIKATSLNKQIYCDLDTRLIGNVLFKPFTPDVAAAR